jgi:hypothetical protein
MADATGAADLNLPRNDDMLITKLASPRCPSHRISRWVDYLRAMKSRHGDDPEAADLLDMLIDQATGWIEQRAEGAGATS